LQHRIPVYPIELVIADDIETIFLITNTMNSLPEDLEQTMADAATENRTTPRRSWLDAGNGRVLHRRLDRTGNHCDPRQFGLV
jgi:hypothetical protein